MVKKIDLIDLFMHHSGEDISLDDVKAMMAKLGDSTQEDVSSEDIMESIKHLVDCVIYTGHTKEFVSFSTLCEILDLSCNENELPEEQKKILKIFGIYVQSLWL